MQSTPKEKGTGVLLDRGVGSEDLRQVMLDSIGNPPTNLANQSEATTLEKDANDDDDSGFYSDVLGCKVMFPLSVHLNNMPGRNPAFKRRTPPWMKGMVGTTPKSDSTEPKPIKSGPPIFKNAADDTTGGKTTGETFNTASKEDSVDPDDVFNIPSHIPGLYWSKREIDYLDKASRSLFPKRIKIDGEGCYERKPG